VQLPGRIGLRPQHRRQPLRCHRRQHTVVQYPGRVHHGGQVGPERLEYGGELLSLGDVAGHQVHLCACPLQILTQLPCARSLFTAPTGEDEPPYPVPVDEMPGQHRPEGPGAAGDQDDAPGERALDLGRRCGCQPGHAQHAVAYCDLGFARGERGGQLS